MRTAMAPPQHSGASARLSGLHEVAPNERLAPLSRELRFCLDYTGRLTLVDGAWRTVLAVEPRDLLGAHWTSLVAPVDHPPMRDAIDRALAGHQFQPELELRMEAFDGGPRIVHWTLVRGSGDEPIAAVGYDRTALHQAAAEAAHLRRRTEELETLVSDLREHSRSMEGFAATAAHQLSEPLIVAESGTIIVTEELGPRLDADLRARLDAIGRGAARARQTIDALLMDARSATEIELQPVSVQRVVAQVLEDLEHRFEERGVVVEIGELPAVRAEPRLLAVVYQNLLSNALKYGPRDGNRVRIDAERLDDGWKLSLESAGAPLVADQTERIFEPWHRIPGERRVPGSGLGLAICARLVERLGGTIGVEPKPDGNAFYFILPAA